MMVLITYDVETVSRAGRKRLRQVAKQCTNYGQRVQNSVFECVLDYTQFTELKFKLEDIIDKEKDSLRYYMLGNNWTKKVEHVGTKETLNFEDDILLA